MNKETFAKYINDPSPLDNDNAMTSMTDFVNDSYAQYKERKAQVTPEAGKEAQDHV